MILSNRFFLSVMLFAVMFSAMGQQRRHAANPVPTPQPPLVFKGATSAGCGAEFFIDLAPSIPSGTIVEKTIHHKDGSAEVTTKTPLFQSASEFYHGYMRSEPFPSDCTADDYYRVTLTTPSAKVYRATTLVSGLPKGVPPVTILPDILGGVSISGGSSDELSVFAPTWTSKAISLKDGYIAPGAIGPLPAPILVCPAMNGNLSDLYCVGAEVSKPQQP